MRKCGNAEKGKSKSRSFTLLEIVFTIVIIGILLAIFLPVMSSIKLAAQKVKDQSNLKTIAGAWKTYHVERGFGTPWVDGNAMQIIMYYAGSVDTIRKSSLDRVVITEPCVYISSADRYASPIIGEAISYHISLINNPDTPYCSPSGV
jgi:type II secretory pathway pseudopilin PulG